MANNYFTRPKGLHPTPSACFPPPPPGQKGNITGLVQLTPNPVIRGLPINLATFVENTLYQTGVPLVAVFVTPGIAPFSNGPVNNRQISTGIGTASGPPGFYTGSVKVTWPNGQIRTFPFSYTIIP